MFNFLLISFGKIFSHWLKRLQIGNGSTWPGHIALKINKKFISQILSQSHTNVILIAGTNGKTTTSKIIRTVLENNGETVIQNQSGANLLNGIASTLISDATEFGKLKQTYAIFEVDENVLPLALKEITPHYLILLNLFRDQLDRYGEVNIIAKKWQKALTQASDKTTLILNADDPQIAYLGKDTKSKNTYFGMQEKNQRGKLQHAADSVYCPQCGSKLIFKTVTFSHLGDWHCSKCGLKRPLPLIDKSTFYPLEGVYNQYNTLAVVTLLKQIGLSNEQIEHGLKEVTPAFGRQEIIPYKNKKVQLFLSKNPTSFNQSYEAIKNLKAQTLLLILNDRIPDGRDVSWIWDVDFPNLHQIKHILISGDRVYDMALRIKYENYANYRAFESLAEAIEKGIDLIKPDETLFILPTYSAMLEARKILIGKKIL